MEDFASFVKNYYRYAMARLGQYKEYTPMIDVLMSEPSSNFYDKNRMYLKELQEPLLDTFPFLIDESEEAQVPAKFYMDFMEHIEMYNPDFANLFLNKKELASIFTQNKHYKPVIDEALKVLEALGVLR